MKALPAWLAPLAALTLVAIFALQVYFFARITLMRVVDPQSTTFQRSEAGRLLVTHGVILWSQEWRDYERISEHLKRAVIASEDARFPEHSGVEWDAIERAHERNQRRLQQAEQRTAATPMAAAAAAPAAHVRLVGGSTITQQLAKNLFLAGERSLARKGQEFILTVMLEVLLSKQRILEIYLNNVEWGEGLFGAQAAARHYFHVDASQLTPWQAASLAVMLPAPKRFEKLPHSAYLLGRADTVLASMGAVKLP